MSNEEIKIGKSDFEQKYKNWLKNSNTSRIIGST